MPPGTFNGIPSKEIFRYAFVTLSSRRQKISSVEGNQIIPLDSAEAGEKEPSHITPEDLVISGANAFEAYGHAVIMAGPRAGGKSLPSFHTMLVEGGPILDCG